MNDKEQNDTRHNKIEQNIILKLIFEKNVNISDECRFAECCGVNFVYLASLQACSYKKIDG
jgi:hypothetical protein